MIETSFPGEFAPDQVWAAIQTLLTGVLGKEVDVDCVGSHDFDEDGALTVTPPAARVLFLGDTAGPPIENQNQVYNVAQGYSIICADQDSGPDPQDQRVKSLQLANAVKHILTGARLALPDGSVTEPIVYVKLETLATTSTGMAYVPQFVVQGIAQFAAPYAYPTVDQEDV